MNVPNAWWGWGVGVLMICAALPPVAMWWRGESHVGCALDGVPIVERQRVSFKLDGGQTIEFCSLTCAEMWLTASGRRPTTILVTDEVSGEPFSADQAYYVRSRIVSSQQVRESRHVFRSVDEAYIHARQFQGKVLEGFERPFSRSLNIGIEAPKKPNEEVSHETS